MKALGRSTESEIVLDHGIGPDRHPAWICEIELAERDLVAPHLTKEILEDSNCQLLARAPPIAEAEWSETGVIANRKACAVDNAENRTEPAIRDVGLDRADPL